MVTVSSNGIAWMANGGTANAPEDSGMPNHSPELIQTAPSTASATGALEALMTRHFDRLSGYTERTGLGRLSGLMISATRPEFRLSHLPQKSKQSSAQASALDRDQPA
jgi:hypothetical protein